MAQKTLYSGKLTEIRPLIWHGKAVFRHAPQLKALLEKNLGEDYKNLFADPHISDDALDEKSPAYWMTDVFDEKPKPLSELPEEEKHQAEAQLSALLSEIKKFSEKLAESKDLNSQKWSEILKSVIQIPNPDFVFRAGDKMVIAAWGFTAKDKDQKPFKPTPIKSSKPVFVPPVDDNPEDKQKEEPEEQKKEDKKEQSENKEKNERPNNQKTEPPEKKEPPENTDKNQTHWFRRYWWLWLILLLLLAFLIWWFFIHESKSDHLPDEEAVIPPVDTTKIVDDPNGGKVLSNRLILWISNDSKTTKQFADDFKSKYPSDNYKIVYYNNTIKRINIEFPAKEKKELKTKLKEQFPDYDLIILDEAIFNNNFIPSDPGFKVKLQSWAYPKVEAYKAWDKTRGSPDVIVAVIDDGFDLSHPELSGKIVKPYNVPESSDKPNIGIIKMSHGTHVAGTAVAHAGNSTGVSGIAPECKLMPVQVGDAFGNMTTTAVIDAVMYSITNDADVVNMSLGMTAPPGMDARPKSEQEAFIQATFKEQEKLWNEIFSIADKKNVTIVLAGGNNNVLIGIDPMQRTPYTINVSATDPSDKKASFSNYGKRSVISAPGVQIYSSVPGNKQAFYDGTSMAAPIVTGAVALIKSVKPSVSNKELKEILQTSAKKISAGEDIGNLLQLSAALGYAESGEFPSEDCPPEIQEKIDSLKREIEELEKECADNKSDTGNMVIPEDPTDFEFAAGRWKSTSDLHNIRTKESVELFFNFNKDGSGKLTMREADGNLCKANLQLEFSGKTLNIIQKNEARCEDGNGYEKYRFSCDATSSGTAVCEAISSSDTKVIDFKLKRVK